MAKKLSAENDPQASPATILACVQLIGLLVRLALAFYKHHHPDAGRALVADLLSREWQEPEEDRKSWRNQVSPEDRATWNSKGPRWRAVRMLRALGETVED